MRKLSNIQISFISLVKSGANGKKILFKSAENFNHERVIKINKAHIEDGIVYGIVYAPDEIDTQGDFASSDEIKKASYGFMKSLNALNVDTNHDFNAKEAFVCESWITKSGDPVFPNEKEGAWAVGIKIESEELKDAIKKGEFEGLSMAGTAEFEVIQKTQSDTEVSGLKAILSEFKNILTGVKKMAEKETSKQEPKAEPKQETPKVDFGEKIDALNKKLSDLETRVAELEKNSKISKQDIKLEKSEQKSEFKGFL